MRGSYSPTPFQTLKLSAFQETERKWESRQAGRNMSDKTRKALGHFYREPYRKKKEWT